MREAITIHTRIIRQHTVKEWPRETEFDDSVLREPNDECLAVDGDEVTITVANGRAVYRLDRENYDILTLAIPAYLVSARLSEEV